MSVGVVFRQRNKSAILSSLPLEVCEHTAVLAEYTILLAGEDTTVMACAGAPETSAFGVADFLITALAVAAQPADCGYRRRKTGETVSFCFGVLQSWIRLDKYRIQSRAGKGTLLQGVHGRLCIACYQLLICCPDAAYSSIFCFYSSHAAMRRRLTQPFQEGIRGFHYAG